MPADLSANGGGTWVCRNLDDSVRWIQLVDLFEAENEFGFQLQDFSGREVDQILVDIRQKIKLVDLDFYYAFSKSIRQVKEKMKMVKNAELSIVDDFLYRIKPSPKSCLLGRIAYEQLANYTQFKLIVVQEKLFESLSTTEKAALLVHEAIYKLQRERKNAIDSTETRKLVGELFSTLDPTAYSEDLKGYATSSEDKYCDICVDIPVGGRFSDGLAPIKVNQLFGFMNHEGKIVIQPKYQTKNGIGR